MGCATGVGIEVASAEVLGGKPLGGTLGQAENVCFITVGSALVEDLLPWGVEGLAVTIRAG
jgi:hypothetical protein